MTSPPLGLRDCLRCGACCVNSAENREEGYPWYVPVDDPGSRLLGRSDLRRRYVTEDSGGVPHLRLDTSGRCLALEGRLGAAVRCRVYRDRPRGCRRVSPGDAACLRAREEQGLRSG
jgi:uncharacterized protein